LRPAATVLKSAMLVLCCVICGYYFTPIAMHFGGFPDNWSGAVGALIGIAGLSVADALVALNYKGALEVWLARPQAKKSKQASKAEKD